MVAVAGHGTQPQGHLALEHQDHAGDVRPAPQQVEQDGAAGVVRQVADDPEARPRRGHAGQVERRRVVLVDLDPGVPGVPTGVLGRKAFVLFHQHQAPAGRRQFVGQRTAPGADFDHGVRRARGQRVDHVVDDPAAVQEMLAQGLSGAAVAPGHGRGIGSIGPRGHWNSPERTLRVSRTRHPSAVASAESQPT
jgi:hypothetical protein